MPSPKHTALLDAAEELFMAHGFGAVGIQRVLDHAGVARRTLYLHFESKDELVVTVLQRLDHTWREHTTTRVEQAATTPRGQLMAIFEALRDDVERPDFYGCVFARAAAEYGHSSDATIHPAQAAAIAHQTWLRAWLTRLTQAAGAPHPETLALQLCTLFDGAMTCAQVKRHPRALDAAINAAEMLIDTAIDDA